MLATVGIFHGLIYLVLVPPWQHYDEPTHFEYARSLTLGAAPEGRQPGGSGLRRELAGSMLEHAFFIDQPGRPNLLNDDPKVRIGISQLNDPPLYYLLIGAVLRPARFLGPEAQLHVARLVSFLLYLGTLAGAYAIVRELFPEDPILSLLIPLFMALTPAFTDLMTAVNNDVGATLVFTLALYFGVRLIRHGLSLARVVPLLVIAALSLLVKSTIWSALPLAVLASLIAIGQRSRTLGWVLGGLLLILLVAAGFLALRRQDAAQWYRRTQFLPDVATSVPQSQAVHGERALRLALNAEGTAVGLIQPVPADQIDELQGKTITFGVWMWSSEPVRVNGPAIWIDGQTQSELVGVGTEPQFIVIRTVVPESARQLNLVLEPAGSGRETGASIFYDGAVLVPGEFSETPPKFLDASGRSIRWQGQSSRNLVRNPSAEARWFTLTPRAKQVLQQFSPVDPNRILLLAQDLSGLGWLYRITIRNLFQSFWARFGWNQIRLQPLWYTWLAALSLMGSFGALWFLIKNWQRQQGTWRAATIWLLLAGVALWLGALFRQTVSFWQPTAFIPSARYAYPAIVPTMTMLGLGWYHLISRLPRPRLGAALLILLFLALDAVSIYTNLTYYAGR